MKILFTILCIILLMVFAFFNPVSNPLWLIALFVICFIYGVGISWIADLIFGDY